MVILIVGIQLDIISGYKWDQGDTHSHVHGCKTATLQLACEFQFNHGPKSSSLVGKIL
jgi:hypothetical protein